MVKEPFAITNIDESRNVQIYIYSELNKVYIYQSDNDTTPILLSNDNINYKPLLISFLNSKRPIILRPTEKLYIKVKPNDIQSMSLIYCIHITSGKAKLSGNIKSLCTPGVKPLFRQFYSFFNDCPNVNDDRIKRLIIHHKYKYPSIVDASELILPFTDLSESIYARMFWNCKKLKYPPKVLPAKTVPENAYSYMFSGCDKLKYIPKILGNTFETNSCSEMFYGCLSLKDISESFPSNFEYTGVNAFLKCFANCIGLEKISNSLFSKELYRHCFKSIFANTKVKTIPKLNLHISRTNKQHQHYFWCAGCYKDMFDNIPDEYFKHMSVFQKNLFIEA